MFDLSNRVALVTGAGQNVGEGIAKLLARQGARVAVNDLFEDRAAAVADAIEEEGGNAKPFAFDVTSAEAVAQGVAAIEDAVGPVDILVNNAGVPPGMGISTFRNTDPAEWKQFIDLNLYGVLHCAKALIEGMVERGHGRIITISSGAAQTGIAAGVSIYGAAKAGGLGFTRHLAMEVASKGVTVNCVALGLMSSGQGTEIVERLAATIPAKRVGTPEDAAAAVLYLASQEASWVTGQTLGVNGGSHMP
jgi:NAD(P)-dependent dehydrogenase (short-subunit alcohol dehydrogenase family)